MKQLSAKEYFDVALDDRFPLHPWQRRNFLRKCKYTDFTVFLDEREKLRKKLELVDQVCSLKRW